MSTPGTSPYAGSRSDQVYEYDDSHSQGLVTFAGVMILIAGVLNTLYGIAAIDKANFFIRDAKYVVADLATFGWLVLILGAVQIFAAFAIWQGTPWGRWFGIACASVNVILQMLWIPAKPVLALTILTMDIIVIYGLLAYGGRRRQALEARARAAAGAGS